MSVPSAAECGAVCIVDGDERADIRAIFTAVDLEEAQPLLEKFLKKYTKSAPNLVSCAEDGGTSGGPADS